MHYFRLCFGTVPRHWLFSRSSNIKVATDDQDDSNRGACNQGARKRIKHVHLYLGRRYLLTVANAHAKPSVQFDHRRIRLTVRPGSSPDK
jgi:hypothetical protein